MALQRIVFAMIYHAIWLIARVDETTQSTTPNLKEIFIGRCWDFNLPSSRARELIISKNLDCEQLWRSFAKAVEFKKPCQVTEEDYRNFLSNFHSGKPLYNKTLFWSGTKDVAHQLSHFSPNFVTLEDTLPGYLLNGLQFCGGKNGFNYTYCPEPKECPTKHVMLNYWRAASVQFAKQAAGITYLMVNGSRKDAEAYMRTSIFGSKELPSLNSTAITELQILNIRSIRERLRESCKSGSIRRLISDCERYGIKTSCIEKPSYVQRILCLKYPTAHECKCNLDNSIKERYLKIIYVLAGFWGGTTLLLLSFIVYKVTRKPKENDEIALPV